MIRRATGFLAAALTTLAMAAQGDFDRNAWFEDYAQLKRVLESDYANLAWKASGRGEVDLPALDRAAGDALQRSSHDAEAADAIRAFVRGFHDGHLSELPYRAAAKASREPELPVLDPKDSQGGCAALSYASTGSVAFTLPFESLQGFRLVSDGLKTSFRSGIMEQSGRRLGLIRIQAFRARAFPQVCIHAWDALSESGLPVTAEAIRAASMTRWFDDLAAVIRSLRESGATSLVIDVGNNSGGDDSGDWAARLFTKRPVRSARLLMVDAPVSAGYFDEEARDLRNALARNPPAPGRDALAEALDFFLGKKARIGERTCDLSWAWREQRPWSPTQCNRLIDAGFAGGFKAGLEPGAYGDREVAQNLAWSSRVESAFGSWSGPVHVLTDRRTYSSAEMFAAVMQDNRVARIVGTTTGGDGCGFMVDGAPLVLVHSRLRFRIPNCMRLRSDGGNEEAGIVPDIPVLPTEGESDRARAARAIAAIVEDLAKPHALASEHLQAPSE